MRHPIHGPLARGRLKPMHCIGCPQIERMKNVVFCKVPFEVSCSLSFRLDFGPFESELRSTPGETNRASLGTRCLPIGRHNLGE